MGWPRWLHPLDTILVSSRSSDRAGTARPGLGARLPFGVIRWPPTAASATLAAASLVVGRRLRLLGGRSLPTTTTTPRTGAASTSLVGRSGSLLLALAARWCFLWLLLWLLFR